MENLHNELKQERGRSAEQRAEIENRYPTIESIVDDYRKGLIMLSEVQFRFPDQDDQDEVLRLVEERNRSEGGQ